MGLYIPATQRCIFQPDSNSTKLIIKTASVPTPNFTKNEHLIKVHAVAPCNGELLWPKNFPPPDEFLVSKELVPCDDLAGTVISGPPNSPFKFGDRVYGRTNYYRTGNAREYTIGVTEELALIPQHLTWAEAATVPLSALTAWQALFLQSGIGTLDDGGWKGKRVLVTAASGSVGAWVVQLARLAGATVVGTCGPHNLDFVRSLGASEALDYYTVDLKSWATQTDNKVNVVIDTTGKKSLEDAWWTIKDGGKIISVYQPPASAKPTAFIGEDIDDLFFIMVPDGRSLSKISELLKEGKVKTNLDSVYPLEKFDEAFARVAGGHAKGKVVIEVAA